MKRISALFLVLFSLFLLLSCAAGRYPYPKSDLSNEAWKSQMHINPDSWVHKADRWFRAGGETSTEIMNEHAPYSEAISRTAVRVPNFHSINISGDFQVQISGNPDNASLWIEGPNTAARSIAVSVRNNVLCLEQSAKAPGSMKRVIVHISVTRLNSLIVTGGAASVEGVRLYSNSLVVDSNSAGTIFLAGHVNVKCVIVRNCGSVNIYTIKTSQTEIESLGSGNVNMTAEEAVGLSSIKHYGTGDINIVPALSRNLMIDAKGKGQINLRGRLGIKEIRAAGEVCVFVDATSSNSPSIYIDDDARVGIAGGAGTLYAYTKHSSRLMARSLVAQTIFAESSGTSHMNINATSRAFANARDYSSIYFYGDPEILESFEKGDGTVIDMGGGPVGMKAKARSRHRVRDTLDPPIDMSANDYVSQRRYRADNYQAY